MDRLMEEDKVLDTDTDSGVVGDGGTKTSLLKSNEDSSSTKSLHVEATCQGKGGMWERFKEGKKASTSKPKSPMLDMEDDSDEVEVYMLDDYMSKFIYSTGRGFALEDDDLDCYDGYEARIYDLSE
ncbi:hypothetical protein Tco_0048120 [Tanacetum coccineum]